MIAAFWLLAVSDNLNTSGRFRAVLPVARRVLGSWVAAIALLLAGGLAALQTGAILTAIPVSVVMARRRAESGFRLI